MTDKHPMVTALRGQKAQETGKGDHVSKALSTARTRGVEGDDFIRNLKKGILDDMPEPEHHTPDQAWGFHLLVDCVEMNRNIDDEEDIKEFFEALIEALDMVPLTDFFCVKVNDKEDGRGISAFQMITTSHIAMHFDDAGRNGFLDIFSCKKFDPRIVIQMIKDHFQPKNEMIQFVYRDTGIVIGKDDKLDFQSHNTV